MNPRRSFGVPIENSNGYGGVLFRSPSPPPSISSLSHLFLGGGGGSNASFGFYGSRPPPPYSSLPPLSLQQPPLLPLPFSKIATLPPPGKRIAVAATARSRPSQKKKTRPRKDPRSLVTNPPILPQKAVEKESLAVDREKGSEEEEEILMGSVYSLSPPPSSLPLPRFSLTRPKAAAVCGGASAPSCIAEAVGGGGGRGGVEGGGRGGVDAGVTDDLRRLLRL